MPWPLYLALKQLFPTGRRITFFTFISVLGVAAGVWLLVAITGVFGGFGEKYRGMIVDTQGDIQVRGQGLIADPSAIQSRLEGVVGVAAVTPFAEGIVLMQFENTPAFPGIQGVDLQRMDRVLPLRRYIIAGSLDKLDDDTVILSSGLAVSTGARIGNKVTVVSPLALEKSNNDEFMLPTELTVVGIFEIGHQQLDSSVAVVTLRRMQDLYGLGSSVHGFDLKLASGQDVVSTVQRVQASLPKYSGLTARTWMEANAAFLFALRLEKMMVTLITGFVVLIAMFLVTALLLIAVVRKTREIGLLSALGGLPRHTAACFCMQASLVGVFGTLIGLGFGFVTLSNLDHIFHALGRLTGSWDYLVTIYQFSQVPAHISAGEVFAISAYAILMSTLAGLIAAWRVAKLRPVEAMRSE